MHPDAIPYSLLLIIAAIASLVMLIYAWRRRDIAAATWLGLMIVASIASMTGYALELLSPDIQTKLLWDNFQLGGVVFMPLVTMGFVLEYLGRRRLQSRSFWWPLLALAAISAVLPWVDGPLGWVRAGIALDTNGLFPALVYRYGPIFMVCMAVQVGESLYAIVTVMEARHRSQSRMRRQLDLILLALLVPFAGRLYFLEGFPPGPAVDLTPFALFLGNLMIAWAAFRYSMLEAVPVARDQVFDRISDGILVLDAKMHLVDVNTTARQMLELDEKHDIGRSITDIIPDLAISVAVKARTPVEISLGKGDREKTFEIRTNSLTGKDNREKGWLLILRDISLAHLLEEALLESEEKYRSLAERSSDGIAIVQDGIIRYCNAQFGSLAGLEVVEVEGHPLVEFVVPEQRELVLDRHTRRAAGEDLPNRYEVDMLRNDKVRIQVEFNASEMDYDGRPASLIFARDITEQKQAQEEVRRSEELYHKLISTSPDSVTLLDLRGKISYHSAEGLKLFGVSTPEEIVGTSVLKWVAWPDRKRALANFLEVMNGNPPLHNQYTLLRKDGSSFIGEINSSVVLGPDGKPTGLIAVTRDITERRRTEQAEREQRTMAEALMESAAAITSTLKLDEVLDRILENLGKVVPHDAANILLIDPETGLSNLRRGKGYQVDLVVAYDSKMEYAIRDVPGLRRMFETGKTLLVEDTHSEAEWSNLPDASWVMSYLGVPLRARGRVIGFLNLDSGTPNFFQPVHASRLQAFADQAAIAIDNARLYDEIQNLAITDELTRIYNRRGLNELGQREVGRAKRFNRPLSVLMFDIDFFKLFNDNYSYLVGDEVLQQLARRCKDHIRNVDVLARYGGEEFVILLVECELPAAGMIAERIRKLIGEVKFDTTAGKLPVTVSVGVACLVGKEIHNLTHVIECAGKALHEAKRTGRNKVVINENNEVASYDESQNNQQ